MSVGVESVTEYLYNTGFLYIPSIQELDARTHIQSVPIL